MKITTMLFDLDGTLLPFDQEEFIKAYFGAMAKKLAPYGFESEKLIGAIWGGTRAMIKNDGSDTNENVFWKYFASVYGDNILSYMPVFDEFYLNEFQHVKKICSFQKESSKLIAHLKESGIRLLLATNPLFPSVATESRIRWAGMSPKDFEIITTYENSRYCKPNPKYYQEILSKFEISAQECIMVGNDAEEDMAAEALGMKVFLLTDCLINTKNVDISVYPHGNFEEMTKFLENEIR